MIWFVRVFLEDHERQVTVQVALINTKVGFAFEIKRPTFRSQVGRSFDPISERNVNSVDPTVGFA